MKAGISLQVKKKEHIYQCLERRKVFLELIESLGNDSDKLRSEEIRNLSRDVTRICIEDDGCGEKTLCFQYEETIEFFEKEVKLELSNKDFDQKLYEVLVNLCKGSIRLEA